MFRRDTDKICQGLPNVFGIAIGILIAGFNVLARVHDETVFKLLEICKISDALHSLL